MKNLFSLLVLSLMGSALFSQTFFLGGDLSYVNQLKDCGVVYYDSTNQQADPIEILSDMGANIARFRLWHNPLWTDYSNYADVKLALGRAKNAGMITLLDFHYSDFWADPSRQWRPEAWNNITDDNILADTLYKYTYNTLSKLALHGLLPQFVQIGNEVNGNILIQRNTEPIDSTSPGMYPLDWPRQVDLIQHGIDAVHLINQEQGADIKIIVHIAKPENIDWWFDNATSYGLTGFDVIGISYYPQWSEYGIREVGEQIAYFKQKYQKDVMIVEFGYPWTSSWNDNAVNILNQDSQLETYSETFSAEDQRDVLIELAYLIKENGGLGLVYWEPAWVSSTCSTYWSVGSGYENATLFDFDNKIHTGAGFLSYDYSVMPPGLADQQVTFKVDMTGIDTQNGVYVTGDFTGDPWIFKGMASAPNNVYEFPATIPGRSVGAYIFYNNNVWDDQYREVVPEACAEYWTTHRKYVVKDQPAAFTFEWSSCNPIGIPEQGNIETPRIMPVPANDFLIIETKVPIKKIRIANPQGQLLESISIESGKINIQHLQQGMFFIRIETVNNFYQSKFLKL